MLQSDMVRQIKGKDHFELGQCTLSKGRFYEILQSRLSSCSSESGGTVV